MFNSIYDKTLNNINSVKDNIADLTDVIRNLNKPNKLIILMFSFELFKQHMDYDSYLDLLKSFPFAIEYIAKTVYNDYGNSIIVYIHLGDCMLSIRKKVKIPDEESLNILKSHSKQIKNQIIAIAKNYSNLAINFLSSISDQIVY